uniref:Regulatory protein AfsR n=1 Tax=Talaromyces marneffei PM1 TaxID=1077442 RepID=A0A093V351_TALMA
MESAPLLRPQSRDEFEIAIICSLPVEWSAVEALLEVDYEVGWLGNQHVVLVYMPSIGIVPATTAATQLRSSFKNIKVAFLVGICGGAPRTPAGEEIVLGDVIISASVIQVDVGQKYPHQKQVEDRLGRASPEIRAFVGKLSGYLTSTRLKTKTQAYYSEICSRKKFLDSAYPGPEKDQLHQADFVHKHWKQGVCSICDKCNEPDDEVCDEALVASCTELGCDGTKSVERIRLRQAIGKEFSENQPLTAEIREARQPYIHFGRMACSNQVIKSGQDRDRITAHEGVIGFEMESAGTWDYVPTIVIKSLCDYADSHKDRLWQGYAATTAAACTKAVLEEWRNVDRPVQNPAIQEHSGSKTVTNPVHWTVTRHPNRLFTGRGDNIRELEDIVRNAVKISPLKDQCCIVISGVGGQGKSEICLQLVNRVRQLLWGIFWVDVSTTALVQAGFSSIANRLEIPMQTWEDVRQGLADRNEPWLLVLDNADNPEVDYQQYFPTSTSGIVILTSRNVDCQQYATAKWISLDGLPHDEACELLLQAARVPYHRHQVLKDDASIVVDLLASHPFALIQAGSYVSRGHCTLKDYAKAYSQHRKRLLTFRSFQTQSRHQDVYTMFGDSVEMLHSSNIESANDALDLLSVLALCAPKPLPITSLFEAAWNGIAKSLENSSNYDMLSLTRWHVSHLSPLAQAGCSTWDSFRLVEAIHQLEIFSFVSVDSSEGSLVLSMHPLAHAWARDRLSMEQEHASWVATGCLFGFSATDTIFWQRYGQQLQPHLQNLVALEMKAMKIWDNASFIMLVESLYPYLDLGAAIADQELDRYLRILRTQHSDSISKTRDQNHALAKVADKHDVIAQTTNGVQASKVSNVLPMLK